MISTKLTSAQLDCAMLIQKARMASSLPTTWVSAWLPLSYVMAHVEIESGFDPTIQASDFASTGSIGLMQVTTATAADMLSRYPAIGPLPQTDPYTSILTGMLYLWTCREILLPIFLGPLAYAHVCVAYNVGPGTASNLSLQQALANRYYLKWRSAQMQFAGLDATL